MMFFALFSTFVCGFWGRFGRALDDPCSPPTASKSVVANSPLANFNGALIRDSALEPTPVDFMSVPGHLERSHACSDNVKQNHASDLRPARRWNQARTVPVLLASQLRGDANRPKLQEACV
jgi:hypothetical protein